MNRDNQAIWNTNAECWDRFMGERGNDWHQELIAPQTEHLLGLHKGNKLLDIGCGNGLFARRMAQKDILVTAFDFSESNIEKAKKYDRDNIDYKVLDATNEEDLRSLGCEVFDGAVANMVLMDMPYIETLLSTLKHLLTQDGVFVFSIQHPAFNSPYIEKGENSTLILEDYINSVSYKGFAIPTQKHEQYYFHRPISYYLRLGFKNGFVIDGYIEPTFNKKRDGFYSKFPPILIIKMKRG